MILEELKNFEVQESSLPKYQQYAMTIEDWLRKNKMTAGTRIPGDRELAKLFGTTHVTISKSLNLLTSKGVLARKVGFGTYVADAKSSRLSHCRIGILCHEIITADPTYVTPVMSRFCGFWERSAYQTVILQANPDQYEKLVEDYELSGVMILVPREEFAPRIRALRERGIPVVTIGGFTDLGLPGVSYGTDHLRAGMTAVEYLRGLGHSRIGITINDPDRSSNILRVRGYEAGMWEAKLPVKPEWKMIFSVNQTDEFRRGISMKDAPTALIIGSHANTMATYNVLKEMNLAIGKDIDLIALDDADYMEQLMPSLTTFAQPVEKFSEAAATALKQMIDNQPVNTQECIFEPFLIKRNSCNPK